MARAPARDATSARVARVPQLAQHTPCPRPRPNSRHRLPHPPRLRMERLQTRRRQPKKARHSCARNCRAQWLLWRPRPRPLDVWRRRGSRVAARGRRDRCSLRQRPATVSRLGLFRRFHRSHPLLVCPRDRRHRRRAPPRAAHARSSRLRRCPWLWEPRPMDARRSRTLLLAASRTAGCAERPGPRCVAARRTASSGGDGSDPRCGCTAPELRPLEWQW